MITVEQIHNGNMEKAKKTLLITYKCVGLDHVLNYFLHAQAGVLFLNFEQK